MKQKIASIFTVLVMLLTSACTPDQRISTLEGVITSLEILLPVLEVATPSLIPIYTMVDSAISGLGPALQQTQTELASLDTDVIKAAKIATYFAPTIASINALPPAAQAITIGVLKAIQAFLATLAPTTTPGLTSAKAGVGHKYTLPTRDQKSIADISARLSKLAVTR